MADSTKEVLLKLNAQFTGWKGESVASIGKQATAAQASVTKMTDSLKQSGAAASQAASATARMAQGGAVSAKALQANASVFDRSAIAQYEASIKSLTRSDMELAAATRKVADAERERHRAMGRGGKPKQGDGFGQLGQFAMGKFGSAAAGVAAVGTMPHLFGDFANIGHGIGGMARTIGQGGSAQDFIKDTAGGWSPGLLSGIFKDFFKGMQDLVQRMRGLEATDDFARRGSIEAPVRQEQRALQHQRYSLAANYWVNTRAPARQMELRKRIQAGGIIGLANQRDATPSLNIVPGESFAYQQRQQQVRDIAENSAQKLVTAAKQVVTADFEKVRAAQKYDEALRLANDYNRGNIYDAAKQAQLYERLKQTAEERITAELKVADAIRNQGAAQSEVLRSARDFHREQKTRYQGIAAQEQERQKDLSVNFATMDPLKQLSALQISRKLQAAKAGNLPIGGPQMRFINGKPVLMPGAGGGLTHEELQEAASNPFLRNQFREYASKAQQNNPILKELMQFEGTTGRQQEAEKQAKISATAEAKLDVAIVLNEESVGQQLEEKFLPKVIQAIQSALSALENKLNAQALANNVNQKHLGGGEF